MDFSSSYFVRESSPEWEEEGAEVGSHISKGSRGGPATPEAGVRTWRVRKGSGLPQTFHSSDSGEEAPHRGLLKNIK